TPASHGDAIFKRVKVASDPQVTAVVAACQADGSLWIRGCASSDHHGPNLVAEQKSRHGSRRRSRGRLSRKEIAGSRIANASCIQQRRSENMRLLKAKNLLAQSNDVGAERIEGRSGEIVAVVSSVNGSERILLREDMVDPRSSKVFANGLQGAGEDFRDAAKSGRGGRRRTDSWAGSGIRVAERGSGPKIEERLNAGNSICARG